MSKGKFGTAINCIDGRVQLPVTNWLKDNYHLDYVDMVTEPGPDRVTARGHAAQVEPLKSKVMISVEAHGSDVVAIAGHHDCAGNPVSREEHCAEIREAMCVIRSWNLPVSCVTGIWVDENWKVQAID